LQLWLILKGIISIDLCSFLSAGAIIIPALLAETAGQALSAGLAAYLFIGSLPKPCPHFCSIEFQSLLSQSRRLSLADICCAKSTQTLLVRSDCLSAEQI
jgi:hypothetical protein